MVSTEKTFELPFGPGRAQRNEGIARVKANAGEEWGVGYISVITAWFAALPRWSEFTGADMRAHAEPFIGAPHHPNVWGARAHGMLHQWHKQQWIAEIGFRESTAPNNHAHVYRVYRKLS